MRRLTATLALLLYAGTLAHGATWYVAPSGNDANPGTQAQPFRTVNRGVAALASGDTLYLRGGTYDGESFTTFPDRGAPIIPSGAPGPGGPSDWSRATILAAYPGEVVTMRNAGISLAGGTSYVIFSHLLMNWNSFAFLGGQGGATHHVCIEDSEFSGEGMPSLVSSANVIQGMGNANEFRRNKVHGAPVTLYAAGFPTTGNYGMYYHGIGNLIDGNEIYGNSGYGIHLYSSGSSGLNDNLISNNIIHGNGYDDGQRGTAAFAIIMAHGSNNQASQNIIYGNTSGIQVGSTCLNCVVVNNTIVNNTLLRPGASKPQATGCIQNEGLNTVIRNNICYGNAGPELQNYATPLASNNLVTPVDPLFINANAHDFQLQGGSPAIDAGANIGFPYAGNAPDLGALERGLASRPQTSCGSLTTAAPPPPPQPLPPPRNLRMLAP